MKFFIFFFLLFISPLLFAEVAIHIGGVEVECVYSDVTGATVCERLDNTGDTRGVWNPKTFSCTNFVTPTVDAAGDIICPSQAEVKIKDSKSTPNPSKDDEGCDPSKEADSGCASQKTAVKTNDLISESNSKLGSVASSNATNTGLLSSILGTLQGIASQGSVGAGAGGSSDGFEPIVTNDKSVGSIYVSSSFGICPTPESFTVLNNNYELSYQFLCDMAQSMRGFVVALGALSAVTLVVTAL
jgi:hypothetical protein